MSRPPEQVLTPGTLAELAEVLGRAQAAGAAVVPVGGGTALGPGVAAAPPGPYWIVRTAGLRRVIEHEPADLTIGVEAGMTLGELDAVLRPSGLMLPVDAPLPARSTIGGVLARAADGPRQLGYGALRDLLIGVQVVEAGGRVSKAGGRVVKNVSGFDMMKLYLGSQGTLAVIAAAHFKLLPLPRRSATALCPFAAPEPALGLLAALAAAPLTPAALELLLDVEEAGARVALALRAEGPPAAVERHLREVRARAKDARLLEGAAQEALWSAAQDLPQTAELAPGEWVLRLAFLPALLPEVLAALPAPGALGLRGSIRARLGIAYLRLAPGPGGGAALLRLGEALAARRAALSVLAAPTDDEGRRACAALRALTAPAPAVAALQRRIKETFDPLGQLNPGWPGPWEGARP